MAVDLCTTADVKLRVEIPDGSDDALLDELIDEVSEWIADFTGRTLGPDNAATYYVDTSAGSVIRVKRGIRSVTSLSIASADQPDDGSGTYTAVAAADILLRPSTIDLRPGWPPTSILIRGSVGRLVAALNGAKIVGNFGFASVPLAIKGVAIDAVATAFTARMAGDSDAIGPEASPVAVWARYFAEGTVQRRTLERYRLGAGIG